MYNYGSISYNVVNLVLHPTDSNTLVEKQDQQVALKDSDNNNNKSNDISNINNNKDSNDQDNICTIEKNIFGGIKISHATQTKLVMSISISISICIAISFKSHQ